MAQLFCANTSSPNTFCPNKWFLNYSQTIGLILLIPTVLSRYLYSLMRVTKNLSLFSADWEWIAVEVDNMVWQNVFGLNVLRLNSCARVSSNQFSTFNQVSISSQRQNFSVDSKQKSIKEIQFFLLPSSFYFRHYNW